MARPKSSVEPEKITITTTKSVVKILDKLLESGMFGRSKTEVAEQLLRRAIEDLLTSEKFEKLTKKL